MTIPRTRRAGSRGGSFTGSRIGSLYSSDTVRLYGTKGGVPAIGTSLAPVLITSPAVTPASGIVLGTVLNVTNGTWTNSPTSYSYQWQRNGVNISGAAGSSYTVVSADSDAMLGCIVTATNASGGTPTASNTVGPAITAIPSNTAVPVVSGSTLQGQTLTCTNGSWTGSPFAYAFQWRRNGVNISGATSSTYVTVSGDLGTNISCAVTATNVVGSSAAAAISNSVGPIATTGGAFVFNDQVNSALTILAGFW
jgi:hypothetical protein